MKYGPYPTYKNSGVEWLGEVPEHWAVKRTRFMLKMNPSKQEINHLDPETELAFLPMEAVGEDGALKLDTTRPIAEVSAGYTFFAEGDVTFAKITPCFENGKGALMRELKTGYGFGTTELTVMRPGKELESDYLYFIAISRDFRKNGEAWMYGAGGQKRVPDEFAKEFRLAFPPLPEQQAIASFLDRETSRIDKLIGKKQKLLELLAEQRTALIQRAVTKGLNAKVKLKSSGVDWLGDVPEHWQVKRLKDLLQTKKGAIKTGPFGSQLLSSEMYDQDVKVYNQKSVITNDFEYGENYISLDKFKELKEFQTFPGDFLITTRGTIGRCAILPINAEQGILHPCLMRLQTNKTKVADRFLEILIEESDFILEQLKIKSNGTTIEVIYQDSLKNVMVLLPPIPEQQAIAAFLDRETAKIDTLVSKVETAIEKLKEYRTALISAAVTGKIDVREAA
jgi:type I restriction enzyme S subunit